MSDEWAPPPSPQDYQGKPSDGVAQMIAKISGLQRQLDELRSNTLKTAGISVEENRIRFGGNVAIEGTLSLPAGIIDNDALAEPIEFGSIGLSTTAFTVPTDWGSVAAGAIDIPLGYTRAAVLGIVSVGAWNASAAGDYIYVRASINGSPGASLPEFAGASAYRSVGASAIRTMDNLTPGDTIPVAVECRAASGWGASGSNIANIDVIAVFRR